MGDVSNQSQIAHCRFRFSSIDKKEKMKIYLVGILILGLGMNCLADTCGGNCPADTCEDCLCGNSKNMVDISEWCSKHSWDQANCECIMSNESGGNANALYMNKGGTYPDSYDLGLWQINDFNWNDCNHGNPPCDPQANLNCAIKVYQWGGNTWKNWSTCSKCGACDSS